MSTQRNSTEYVYINGQKVPKSQITYTDGGQATDTGVYPMSTYGASGSVSSASSASPTPTTPNVGKSGYTYVPGSAAPTNGNVMDYATWLQGNTKYQAGQMREQAVKQAESDRQRAIVDANSSYSQNQALYGANAENMASMGLSSSGYGEYLTGKAYATQRADVQKANAAAQARKDQVLYEEGQMKINADKEYAEMLISFRDKTNSQYQSDYNSALNGTSLEAIMQSGSWNDYTPEQQATIRGATIANGLRLQIDGGSTIDDIINNPSSGWNNITVSQQQELKNYYSNKAANQFTEFSSAIKNGSLSLDEIKAMPGYANLSEPQKARLEEAAHGIASDKAYNDILADAMRGDYTAESVLNAEGYANLSEAQKDDILDAINEKAYKDILDGIQSGEYTAESVQSVDGYQNLNSSQKNAIDLAIKTYQDGRQASEDKTFLEILGYIQDGSLRYDDIKNTSLVKGLKNPDLIKQLESAQAAYDSEENENKAATEEAAAADDFVKILEAVRKGESISTIKEAYGDRFDNLSEPRKNIILEAEKEYNDSVESYSLDAIRQNISNYTNFSDLMGTEYYKNLSEPNKITVKSEFALSVAEGYSPDLKKTSVEASLKGKGYSTSEIDLVVSQWQNSNLQNLVDSGETFYASEIDALIRKGAIPANSDQILRQAGQLDTLNGAQGPVLELPPNNNFDIVSNGPASGHFPDSSSVAPNGSVQSEINKRRNQTVFVPKIKNTW